MYYQQLRIDFTPEEVIDYLRKSRSDDPLLTVEEVLQKHETILDEWAEKHLGGKVPEKNKFREVVSGETLKDRPEIQKVLRLIESPKYKAIKIVEPQRLTRGDLESIGRIMKLLKHTNTLVITPQKIYNLRDEYDWDAFERELKRGNDYLEYTKKILSRGKLLAVSQGQYLLPYPPYGYDKITIEQGKKKCPTLRANKEQADAVRLIFDLYVNKGWGTKKIGYYLDSLGIKPARSDKWSSATIKDLLSNVHYIGKVKWNCRKQETIVEDSEIITTRPRVKEYLIFDGLHDGIIDEELYQAAQDRKGKNPRYPAKKKVANPFASLLFCACGRTMSYRPFPRAKPRLICAGKPHCRCGSCVYEDFEAKICGVLEECIADFEIRVKNNEGDSVKLHERLVKNLESRLKALQEKELAQWEAQTDPNDESRMPPEIFKQLNAKLLNEKEEVQQALCAARASMPAPVDYEEKAHNFREALAALRNPAVNAEEKNRLLKACIERITYSRDELIRLKDENGKYLQGQRGGVWNNPPMKIDVKLRV